MVNQICEINFYVVFTIYLVITVILIKMIINRAPKLMLAYRWYLIVNVLSSFASVVVYSVFRPTPVRPYRTKNGRNFRTSTVILERSKRPG